MKIGPRIGIYYVDASGRKFYSKCDRCRCELRKVDRGWIQNSKEYGVTILVYVCSNCHEEYHRDTDWYKLEKVYSLVI